MSGAFRIAHPEPAEEPKRLRGAQHHCPHCGQGDPKAKTWGVPGPNAPKHHRGGWWHMLIYGCNIRGNHLHQDCGTCKGDWTAEPKEKS